MRSVYRVADVKVAMRFSQRIGSAGLAACVTIRAYVLYAVADSHFTAATIILIAALA